MRHLFVIFYTCTLSCLQLTSMGQSGKMHNARFNHLAIYVVDLQRSADFYKNVVGLDTIPEPFHNGKYVWLKTGPGIALHIIQGAESKKEYYKNNHICFSVNSMDVLLTCLIRRIYYMKTQLVVKITRLTSGPMV